MLLGVHLALVRFRLRGYHPLWLSFPADSSTIPLAVIVAHTPQNKFWGLGCSAFARHYLRNRIRFLFLRLLRCFTSAGIALTGLCIQPAVTEFKAQLGFPIRKSSGSKDCFRLPGAYRR